MIIRTLLPLLLTATLATAGQRFAYIGSYTGNGSTSKGITLVKMDTETGALTVAGTAAELQSPSFLALNTAGTHLYAVSESGNSAAAFLVDKTTGALTKLNELPVADAPGQGACHLCLVPGAKMLVTANYGGGSVSTFALAPDGSLARRTGFIQHTGSSADPGRQKEPHGHGAILSPDGQHVLVNDLGTDRVYIYKVDAPASALVPKPAGEGILPPGSGPRHSTFDPSGRHVHCLNEMLLTVTTFQWDPAAPALRPLANVSTLPADTPVEGKGYSTAEIVAHPNGKIVYSSNRGHDTIAVFAQKDSTLTLLQNAPSGGKTPRNFNLTPDGKFLVTANQDSDNLAVLTINPDGQLTPTPHTAPIGRPVCIVFLPE